MFFIFIFVFTEVCFQFKKTSSIKSGRVGGEDGTGSTVSDEAVFIRMG